MIGAIIGDIVGSRFEFNNHRSTNFQMFDEKCEFTDDTVMTLAVARAIMDYRINGGSLSEKAITWMRRLGRKYPKCSYGTAFTQWLVNDKMKAYFSYGNGAAMRVSACAWNARKLGEALELTDAVTKVTHNHPEGMKGARATATAIFMAKVGMPKSVIKGHIRKVYGYSFDRTIDEIRETYQFNETCQETVPQAIEAYLEAESFEEALRLAISVGGDSDTLAAITCSIAEAHWGVPKEIRREAENYLDDSLKAIMYNFELDYER